MNQTYTKISIFSATAVQSKRNKMQQEMVLPLGWQ